MKKAQEQIDKLYDITDGQQIIVYAEMAFVKKNALNIPVSLHFDTPIDASVMLHAIELEIERCDAFRIRFTKVDKAMKFYFSSLSPAPVEQADFYGKSQEEYDSYMDELAKRVFPNARCNVQLYRFALVRKPDGLYAVMLVVHHLIMDTYSIFSVLTEIVQLYDALRSNRELPVNQNNVLACYEADREKMQSANYAEKQEKIVKFWDEQVYSTEPFFTSVNGNNSRRSQLIPGKRYGSTRTSAFNTGRHINLTIPADLVNAVDEYAKEHKVSGQALFMLAIRSHLSRENGFVEDVSLNVSTADRATKLERHSALTRANSMMYRMNLSNSLSFAEACEQMTTLQMSYYRYADIKIQDTIKIMRQKFDTPLMHNYYNIMLTYQRYGVNVPDDMSVHAVRHEVGVATSPLTLMIVTVDNSGDLLCNYDYAVKDIDASAIYALHENMIEFLRRGLAEPQKSLDELMHSYPLKLSGK